MPQIIVLKGNPLSTQSAYGMRGKIRYMTARAKALKTQYQWEAKSQWKRKPLETLLHINIKLYFGNHIKRDWDNYHKISMDALSGIVWKDDSQIKRCYVEVFIDKEDPRMEVAILDEDILI